RWQRQLQQRQVQRVATGPPIITTILAPVTWRERSIHGGSRRHGTYTWTALYTPSRWSSEAMYWSPPRTTRCTHLMHSVARCSGALTLEHRFRSPSFLAGISIHLASPARPSMTRRATWSSPWRRP